MELTNLCPYCSVTASCAQCGKRFVRKQPGHKFCKIECRTAARRNRPGRAERLSEVKNEAGK